MHRVRIGITGLACVLLLVLFAAAIVGFQTRDAARSDNLAATNNEVAEQPKDPLAELGVDHAQGFALHRPELAMLHRGIGV